MDEIFRRGHYRRAFFFVIGLVGILILVGRDLVLPHFDPQLWATPAKVMARLLDDLFASLLVTVAVGGFIFWFTPKVIQKSHLEKVDAREIGQLLHRAADSSDRWHFRGGTGRYTRAQTLPRMAKSARSLNARRDVVIEVLDPNDISVCRQYASYRAGVNSAIKDPERWTEKRVRMEICATILAAYVTKTSETLVSVAVVLSKWYSSFRLDMSSDYVIVTREDSRAPGMRADTGTYFYDAYRDDLMLTASQGRKLQDCNVIECTPTEVRKLFDELSIVHADFDDADLSSIIYKATKPADPYA